MQAIQPALHTYLLPSSLPSRINHISLFLHLTQSHQLVFPTDFSFAFFSHSISLFIFSYLILFFLAYRSLLSTVSFLHFAFCFSPFTMIKKAISPLCQPPFYLCTYHYFNHRVFFYNYLILLFICLLFLCFFLFFFLYKNPAFFFVL